MMSDLKLIWDGFKNILKRHFSLLIVMFLFQRIVLNSLFLENMKTNVVIEELIEFCFLSASNLREDSEW